MSKTTTTLNLGEGLVRAGKKVLLIDADAQASLTESLGYHMTDQFLMLLVGILPAIPVALNKRLIDGLSAQSRSSVFTCVLICVFIGVLEIVVSILENICGVIYQKVNYQTTHKMERKFYYTLTNLPMEVFDDYKLRKKIVLAQDGLSTNGIEIMENLISIISNTISIVSVFVMLFMVSWKLPIAIVGSMVPTLVAVIVSKKNAIPSASGIGGRKKKKRLS